MNMVQRLGDENREHLSFFFCGHGIAKGQDLALLLPDFAAVDKSPLHGAFDFDVSGKTLTSVQLDGEAMLLH